MKKVKKYYTAFGSTDISIEAGEILTHDNLNINT